MPFLPTELRLSLQEREALDALIRCESSSLQFWMQAFATRGIVIPASKVPVTFPTANPSIFRLEWHPRRLGPKAIAEGIRYRAYTEKKDKEFSARLTKRGLEVWT